MADKTPPNEADEDSFIPLSLDDPNNPIAELNKQFYGEYDEDYFVNKAVVLASFIADVQPMKEHLDKGFSVGKLTVKDSDIDSKWLEGYAKRELAINSYHAIESFFRLFFAHIENPDCPWVGVEQMQSFREFKDRIDKLIKREYFEGSHDEEVAKILLGPRELYSTLSDEEWQKGIANAVYMLVRLGSDILNNQDYNVYKHGAALLDTQFGFQIDDGKVIGADKQDTFMYLSSKTEKTPDKVIKQFSRTFKFIRWEQRFTSTYLSGMLLHNMLALHKSRLRIPQPKDTQVKAFNTLDMDKLFDFDNGDRIAMPDTMSIGLFERHYNTNTTTQSNGKKKRA
ncbi:MAG TPA: hypothetical protein VK497_03840 [Candidatus Saccharimonadales bacterium]|nr:hypothetical protein [Candidatus Saccharimonadales bacterium]